MDSHFTCTLKFMEDKFDVRGEGDTPSEAGINAIKRFAQYMYDNAESLYDHGTIVPICRRR